MDPQTRAAMLAAALGTALLAAGVAYWFMRPKKASPDEVRMVCARLAPQSSAQTGSCPRGRGKADARASALVAGRRRFTSGSSCRARAKGCLFCGCRCGRSQAISRTLAEADDDQRKMMEERCIIVNDADEPVRPATKAECEAAA